MSTVQETRCSFEIYLVDQYRDTCIIFNRWDLLGPVNVDEEFNFCVNGTFLNGCDGCFNVSEINRKCLYVLRRKLRVRNCRQMSYFEYLKFQKAVFFILSFEV